MSFQAENCLLFTFIIYSSTNMFLDGYIWFIIAVTLIYFFFLLYSTLLLLKEHLWLVQPLWLFSLYYIECHVTTTSNIKHVMKW